MDEAYLRECCFTGNSLLRVRAPERKPPPRFGMRDSYASFPYCSTLGPLDPHLSRGGQRACGLHLQHGMPVHMSTNRLLVVCAFLRKKFQEVDKPFQALIDLSTHGHIFSPRRRNARGSWKPVRSARQALGFIGPHLDRSLVRGACARLAARRALQKPGAPLFRATGVTGSRRFGYFR